MKIPLPKTYFRFLIVALLLVGQFAVGQTNPVAQSLPYTQDFSSLTGNITAYPAGWQGWDVPGTLNGNYVTAAPNANRGLMAGNNNSINRDIYNMNGKVGIMSTFNGISSLALAINTTSATYINVSFKVGTQHSSVRICELGLQYRVGTSGAFINVTGATYQNTGTSHQGDGTEAINVQTISVILPAGAENKPEVQLRWIAKDISGDFGNRCAFSIDDISVSRTPTLTATPASLTFTSVANGAASTTQDVTISGSNLTPNTGQPHVSSKLESYSNSQTEHFEYSADNGATYVSFANLPITSNSVSKILKVRLKANQIAGPKTDKILLRHNDNNSPFIIEKVILLSATVTVPISKPVVANQTINGNFGTAINYQIVATNTPTAYAIASGTLPAGLSLNTTSGIISGTPTTVAVSTVTVTATNSAGTSTPATLTFNIAKGNQTITFAVLPPKQYGDADFIIAATASSGLTVTYTSSNTSVAEIVGANIIKIIGVGTTDITASQAGNANYNAATPVAHPFTVTAKSVTVVGVTANNKVEDGTTTASLSGTPALNGVLAADVSNVTLAGVPAANFATATAGMGKVVTVSGYTLTGTRSGNYVITQPTGLTANITALVAPVATAATSIGSTSFIANWDAVTDASNYRLDVYTGTDVPGTTITETFTAITGGAGSAYENRSWIGDGGIGWNSFKSRIDQHITGTDLAVTLQNASDAYLISDVITGGLSNISFDVQQFFGGTGGILTIKVLTGPTFSTTTTIGTKSYNTTASAYDSGLISGITGDYKIRIENNAAAIPAIDNLSFTSADTSTMDFVAGYENLSVGNVTSHLVSGLTASTEYKYKVRAVLGTATSPNSNVINITTTATGTDVIWDGAVWSNGTGPDASIAADIQGVYDTTINGVFTAKALTVTSGSLIVRSGASITVIGALTNTLSANAVVLENNANLIQGGTTNENSGNITVKRNSSALMRQDYTLWSSPTFGDQTLLNFSLATLTNRFYEYNSATDLYSMITPSATNFATGKSYLIRMPNNHPAIPTVWTGSFVGKPNSGNISYALAVNTTPEHVGNSYNAIGNPYPSPIDAIAFLNNTNNASSLTGTLYFWRKTNNAENPTYSTFNVLTGFSGNGQPQVFDPNGVIQTGQGFIAENSGVGTADFTNAMRVDNHANQFFKTNNAIERNRIWLNATNADGLFSQTLVGYVTDASDDLDRADGKYMNDGPIALTSIINDTALAIQGRSLPFQASDIVPLQFTAKDAGTYTIAIDHLDGLFEADQAIYLRDALTGAQHDLKAGAYTFASEAGTFADRFNLAYTNLLSVNNSVFDANAVVVYKNDTQSFTINSGNATMQTVKVFDIRGRLLATQNNINATQTIVSAGQANEVLLVQVTSVDGITVTKKVVR